MPRLAIPLSDLQCRTAKTRERAYKLFDGGGMYLFVKPNGVKTWLAQLTKHPAQVNGGHCYQLDPRLDREARAQISDELGHERIEIVSAYIGGRA